MTTPPPKEEVFRDSVKIDAAFEEAMRQTWQMVDPIRPAGQPGSYYRGEHNGICAALKTLRDNYERIRRAEQREEDDGGRETWLNF